MWQICRKGKKKSVFNFSINIFPAKYDHVTANSFWSLLMPFKRELKSIDPVLWVTFSWSSRLRSAKPALILDQGSGAFFLCRSRKITDLHSTFGSWGHCPRSKQLRGQICGMGQNIIVENKEDAYWLKWVITYNCIAFGDNNVFVRFQMSFTNRPN